MNSETMQDLKIDEMLLKEREKQQQAEYVDKVNTEAMLAKSFEDHPFWKLYKKGLEEVRDKLINELIRCDGTKEQMRGLQREIKSINLFVGSPKQYIEKLKTLVLRKRSLR